MIYIVYAYDKDKCIFKVKCNNSNQLIGCLKNLNKNGFTCRVDCPEVGI